jgi:hypothetical protein
MSSAAIVACWHFQHAISAALPVVLTGDHPSDNWRGIYTGGDLPQVYKSPQPIHIRDRPKHVCHTLRGGAMICCANNIFLDVLAYFQRPSPVTRMLRRVSYSPIGLDLAIFANDTAQVMPASGSPYLCLLRAPVP